MGCTVRQQRKIIHALCVQYTFSYGEYKPYSIRYSNLKSEYRRKINSESILLARRLSSWKKTRDMTTCPFGSGILPEV